MQQKKANKKKPIRKSVKKPSKTKVSKKLKAALDLSKAPIPESITKAATLDLENALKDVAVEIVPPKELGFFGKIMKYLFNK